jgi:hypothetical protein
MDHKETLDIFQKLKPARIILPILIGLLVVIWFVFRDLSTEVFDAIHFTWKSAFWLTIGFCCMLCRDLGYIIRIRILTDNDLSWRQ